MTAGAKAKRWLVVATVAALIAFGFAGCATDPIVESGPEPRVADCALIKQATPTLYVCNGKVYTAQQLWALRHNDQNGQ